MKRRHVLGVAGGCLLLVVDCLSFPFLLSSANDFVESVFYGPWLLGRQVLILMREHLGMPIASGARTPVSYGWDVALLLFNWSCYAALGFFLGAKLGRGVWKEP